MSAPCLRCKKTAAVKENIFCAACLDDVRRAESVPKVRSRSPVARRERPVHGVPLRAVPEAEKLEAAGDGAGVRGEEGPMVVGSLHDLRCKGYSACRCRRVYAVTSG